MAEPLSPDAPLPPGVPRVEDLDVPEPVLPPEPPVHEDADALEPPD